MEVIVDTTKGVYREQIVRCKDCKYCKRKKGTFRGEPIFFYRCAEHNRDVENDDFCSFGDRKTEPQTDCSWK